MPGCSESLDYQVVNNRNANNIKCKYCNSLILLPSSATFTNVEVSFELKDEITNVLDILRSCFSLNYH